MAPLVIPDCWQVRLIWNFGGNPYAVNVLHVFTESTVVPDSSNAADMADALEAAHLSSNLDDFQVNDVTLAQVGVRNLNFANQPEILAPTTAAGISTGDPLPLMVSLCVTLRTALAGRSFRGRVYIPGWTEGANDTLGNPSAAAAAAALDFIDDFNGQLSTVIADMQLGVASRKLSEVNVVTTTAMRDLIWDTQRRRVIPGI
jgi:hypothetical protein